MLHRILFLCDDFHQARAAQAHIILSGQNQMIAEPAVDGIQSPVHILGCFNIPLRRDGRTAGVIVGQNGGIRPVLDDQPDHIPDVHRNGAHRTDAQNARIQPTPAAIQKQQGHDLFLPAEKQRT